MRDDKSHTMSAWDGHVCRPSTDWSDVMENYRSQFKLLDLHSALEAGFHCHAILVLDSIAPFMDMSASANNITKLLRSGLAEIASLAAESIRASFPLEVHELLLELGFFAGLLLCLSALIFVIKALRRTPLLGEGVLFDLETEEEHHVVPMRLVRVRLVEMGKQIGVA